MNTNPNPARVVKHLLTDVKLHEGQRRMLQAHAKAPGRALTAKQLAEAAGFAGYPATNLHYGDLGKQLQTLAPIDLSGLTYDDGAPVMTGYIAMGGGYTENGEWLWIMRPEIAEAVEAIWH
jgi:hypothetical protein